MDHPLIITTHDGEVTIGMDHYHMHFEWPAREQHWTLDPLAFLDALMSEDVAVESSWKDGKWAGSTALSRGEAPVAEPGLTTRVRSWRGTRDRDLPDPSTE